MTEKKPRPYKHPQVNLRIPENLKGKIQKIADENNRSMNAEIIVILNEYVSKYDLYKTYEQKIENLNLMSMGENDLEPKELRGAIEIFHMIEEQSNRYRKELLNHFINVTNEKE